MLLPVMQTEEEKMPRIDDLCTWSQIAQPSQNFTARQGALLQGAIDIVWSEWGVFRKLIVTRPHVLARENVLLSFLQMSTGKLTDLVFVDSELIDNLSDIPGNVASLAPLQAAWPHVVQHHTHIRRFYACRGATRLRDFVELVTPAAHAVGNASTVDILQTIGTIVEAASRENINHPGRYEGITRGRNGRMIAIICRLCRDFPPGSHFAGFAGWGNGNHTSISTNIRFHFMKHVLFMDTEGGLTTNTATLLGVSAGFNSVEATHQLFEELTELEEESPAFSGECAEWWRALRMVLPRTVCEARIAPDDRDRQTLLGIWCPGAELLSGYIGDFVESGIIQRNPRLLAWFLENYERAYRDYAVRCSTSLHDIVVSSDGDSVFVAGTNGDDFVIGRLDESTGQLGISSCYKPADPNEKMRGHHLLKLWSLV